MATNNELMLQTIIKGLEAANTSIKNLEAKVHSSEISLTGLNSELNGIRKDLNELVTIIRGNNSKDTLVHKVLTLENEQKLINEYIESAKKTHKENVAGQWQFKTSLVTSILAFLGTSITIAFNFLK